MDIGGSMRNGHTKAFAVAEKEKATPKSRRRPEAEVLAKKNRAPSARAAKPGKAARRTRGVAVERRFTAPGVNPLDAVVFERRSSAITNPD
jgi:hypothetical protein